MDKELTYLGKAVTDPIKPFVAIIGGAKVSDKIMVIDNLLNKADAIIVGGGMAYTFLNAQGQSTGKSLVEPDKLDIAKAALAKAAKNKVHFLLPIDHVLADKFAPDAATQVFSGAGPVPADLMALDIGPKSIALFSKEIADAHTIIWNGPMGVFEMPAFAKGTNAIARHVPSPPTPTPPLSSAEETQSPPSTNPASPPKSPTFPPAAEPPSNSSKAKPSPASPP